MAGETKWPERKRVLMCLELFKSGFNFDIFESNSAYIGWRTFFEEFLGGRLRLLWKHEGPYTLSIDMDCQDCGVRFKATLVKAIKRKKVVTRFLFESDENVSFTIKMSSLHACTRKF